MSNNIPLVQKYRPTKFADVVSQSSAVSVLKKIAASEDLPVRSIFLKGSYGSGKTTLARIFGKALNCKHFKDSGDVCNQCTDCLEAANLASNTYLEFDATATGGIDDIRRLSELLSFQVKGRRLVCLDEVHACSKSALNGLLKIVEDGVPNTIFLFCSTEDILPTLASRSLPLEVSTIPPALMGPHLEKIARTEGISVTSEVIDLICSKSDGHMRNALSLLQLHSLSPDALRSPYPVLCNYIVRTLQHDPKACDILTTLLTFPTVEVRSALYLFLRNIFTAQEGVLYNLRKAGLGPKLFSYFYAPHIQQALQSEAGLTLALQSFYDKLNPIK